MKGVDLNYPLIAGIMGASALTCTEAFVRFPSIYLAKAIESKQWKLKHKLRLIESVRHAKQSTVNSEICEKEVEKQREKVERCLKNKLKLQGIQKELESVRYR